MSFFIRFYIFTLALGLAFIGGMDPAQAMSCETDHELILQLHEPQIGSYNVWDSVHGEKQHQEAYVSGVVREGGYTVMAGERFSYIGGEVTPFIVNLERRGRVLWEKTYPVEGVQGVLKILKHKDGYMLIANLGGPRQFGRIWMGFIDSEGELQAQKILSEKNAHLHAEDFIYAHKKGHYILAAGVERRDGEMRQHGVLFELDQDGKIIRERAYLSGLENRILGVRTRAGGDYVAAGYIYNEDGRKTGWILKLDAKGNVIWQRQYPRGRSAQLNVASGYRGDSIIVAGDTVPFGGGNRAAWLMMVEGAAGNINWQRYYRGDLTYTAEDLVVNGDGLISLLLDTKPAITRRYSALARYKDEEGGDKEEKEPGWNDYVRLLTIDPRGVLFISDEYFNGHGVDASELLIGRNGERVMIGSSKMVYQIEDAQGVTVKEEQSRDGWAAAASAVEPYRDPCVQPYSFLP